MVCLTLIWILDIHPLPHSLNWFHDVSFQDLRAINNMVRMGERKLTGKRILEVDHDDDVDDSPSKKMCSSRLMRRLQDVNSERQEANGIVN